MIVETALDKDVDRDKNGGREARLRETSIVRCFMVNLKTWTQTNNQYKLKQNKLKTKQTENNLKKTN